MNKTIGQDIVKRDLVKALPAQPLPKHITNSSKVSHLKLVWSMFCDLEVTSFSPMGSATKFLCFCEVVDIVGC